LATRCYAVAVKKTSIDKTNDRRGMKDLIFEEKASEPLNAVSVASFVTRESFRTQVPCDSRIQPMGVKMIPGHQPCSPTHYPVEE
jgi:hypothetical protein